MTPLKLRIRGNMVALAVVALMLAWIAIEFVVGIDFLRDRYDAYEGTVLEIRGRCWYDHLALEFLAPEHLIIETSDGRVIDRYVTAENRAHQRIAPGDHVVKERGYSHHAHVPGKPTVQEMLDGAGR